MNRMDPPAQSGNPAPGATGIVPAAGMATAEAAVRAPDLSRARRLAGGLVALTKPRIVELLLVTTVPTMILADRGMPSPVLIAATVFGGALAAGGANALNMVYDRDIDAVMSRTRHRPIVTGDVSPRAATTFALGLEAAAFLLLYTVANPLAAGLAVGAAAFYVGVYTMGLKRRTRHNIVIGGAAGAAPPLVAWAAVAGHLGTAPWVLFALVFLWTPPHFWALAIRFKDDYGEAGVPMLPVAAEGRTVANQIAAYALALCAVSLILGPVAHLGPAYLVVAVVAGVVLLWKVCGLRAAPTPERALQVFHYSISYLTLIFAAVAVVVLVGRP